VSLPTIHRVVKKLGETHKKVERMYTERDKELRDLFAAKLMGYRASQLIYCEGV